MADDGAEGYELDEMTHDSLSMMQPKGFETVNSQHMPASYETAELTTFKEERRGLLTNEIHLDKYPQETLMEL